MFTVRHFICCFREKYVCPQASDFTLFLRIISRRNREHYEFFKERGQKNGGRRAVLFAGHQLAPFPRAAHFLLRRFTVTKGQGEG